MTSTDVTGATSGTATSYASLQMGSGVATDKSTLGSQQFLNLLVTQLKNQDPSAPTDSAAIMQQTATLSQVESTNSMTQLLQQQFAMQQRLTASAYVGEQVTYTDGAGKAQTGAVTGASFSAASPTLTIGGKNVAMDSVTGISAPAATSASATTTQAAADKTTTDKAATDKATAAS